MEVPLTPPDETRIQHIPQCCCGRTDCPFLAHTGTLLEGLERDVSTAAQLGQALLVRHEAYILDSEQERLRMTATIEALEQDKRDLEAKNLRAAEENHDLLEQLGYLNDTVSESNAQIKNLEVTLEATQAELARVSILAARTEALENELALLEREQGQLHETLTNTKEDERSAVQRWRTAERMIFSLQDQIDRIEKESREERERHVEVVARIERRRAVEKELQNAAGRLKGAAAAKTTGSNVVSHFVKDILQDNANLQMGIVELREMLLNSNEEVERLREQLQFHQPISPNQSYAGTPTLQKELGFEPPVNQPAGSQPVVNQELHVHHHYHAPAPPKEEPSKARTQAPRRVKRKGRNVITSGHFTPPSHSRNNSMSRPNERHYPAKTATPASSSAAILSQTSVTIPNRSHRWSIQSNQTTASTTFSSVPNSPTSNSQRASSIFDRVFSDAAFDSSRPTSPESNDPGSPMFLPSNGPHEFTGKLDTALYKHSRRGSNSLKPPLLGGLRSASMPNTIQSKSTLVTATVTELNSDDRHSETPLDIEEMYLSPSGHPTIPEENEDASDGQSISTETPSTDISTEDIYANMQSRRGLRRHASHESMISVSGMDIHTLRSHPSQLLLLNSPRFASPSTSMTSSKPVLSAMTATATRASMSRQGLDSHTFNRSLLYGTAADQRGSLRAKPSKDTLGKRMGGWVFGKWGSTPATSSPPSSRDSSTPAAKPAVPVTKDTSRPTSQDQPAPTAAAQTPKPPVDPLVMKLRPPGINQSGPLLGFFAPAQATPVRVVVTNIDEEALRDSLREQ
ncbi:hypothetical protein BU16DRAFT_616704 [Lophium mytilinum]|uniref:Uncharacterized protein n=1 Tax=Lophium mytilinum TaxID=390894 RepID=A0A6A6QVN5_9PEZI|nr:hypothetical protein BU16DRAFT_616704 [Lophium mytilinum]